MRRVLPLLTLFLPLLGCDEKGDAPKAKPEEKAVVQKPPAPPPTTGNPRIREARKDILDEVEKAEKDLANGTRPMPHLVANWKRGVDNLILATQLAVEKEAEQTVRSDLSVLRAKQAALDKLRNDLGAAVTEIQGYLDRIKLGERPPEGFTEDELKDRLGERQEQQRALEKEEDDLRARMREKEELLAKGKPPPQGETLHTHELAALKELKARVEALAARLKE